MQVLDCEQSVCTIRDNTSRNLTIKVNWFKSHFGLTIFDGVQAYSGVLGEDEIVRITNQLGTITVDNYIKECKTALTTSDGCENFIYIIDNNLFQWKKVVSEIRITFGSVILSEIPVLETLHDMLNVLVVHNKKLLEANNHLNVEKASLENDNKEMLQKTEEYIHMKSDTEFELLNLFLVVLNTKKKKISQLQNLLKANKIDASHIDNEDATKTISDLYECDTEVESDSENTDEEIKGTQQKSVTKPESRPKQFNVLDSESDSDEKNLMFNIPKRNNRIGKDVDNNNKKSSNAAKQNKRQISKRENEQNYADEEAGPSGLKLSKVEERRNNECNKTDVDSIHQNNRIGVSDECKESKNYDNSTECDNRNDNLEINNAKKCTKQTSNKNENREIKSSIDDILAGLID